MRPRTTGISAAASSQELPPQSFKPKSEWKHEKEASFLLVYLPGFQLDQLTISPDYSNRMVRVEGRRRLPNGRLLPVNETFSIPEDCDLPKMDKQFGRGILLLKFPRNVVIPQEQTVEEPNEERETSSDETSKPQDTVLGDLMTRKDEETDPLKETSTPNPKETVQGDSMTQKGEKIDPPKATSTTGSQEQSPDKAAIVPLVKITIDEQSTMKAAESDEQKTIEKKEENDASGKPAQPESPEHLLQNAGMKEEEAKEKHKESTITSAMDVSKVEEKKVKKGLKFGNTKRKEAEKENANTSTKKGMVKELNGDRKLIINIGAAVLIIMGLGVSLFYTIGQKVAN